MMDKGIVLALLQTNGNALHPDSPFVAASAVRLSREGGGEAVGIILSARMSAVLKRQLQATGLARVFAYINPRFADFVAEEYLSALLDIIRKIEPEILLAAATPEGRTLTAMAASVLKTGVTADCTALSIRKDGLLLQTRPAFGGNVMAEIITPTSRPQIATLRYAMLKNTNANDAIIKVIDADEKYLGRREVDSEWVETLEETTLESGMVIAVGGGLAKEQDIALFKRIADKIGAQLRCSRALVDRGWFPRSSQIGLSGKRIHSKLLVTFGVSGSIQFMAGVQGVHKLIAVNTDENAPIMKAANIPIAGNLYDIARAIEVDWGAEHEPIQ